jgi:hypothetical protein
MLAIAEPRAKSKAECFHRPYGTDLPFTSFPSTSYWATFTESLRDKSPHHTILAFKLTRMRGGARLSETAGSPATHRLIWPNGFPSRDGSWPNRVQLRPRSCGPAAARQLPDWEMKQNTGSSRESDCQHSSIVPSGTDSSLKNGNPALRTGLLSLSPSGTKVLAVQLWPLS